MNENVNTGVYLRILWDELRFNMEHQLLNKGFSDITPSHGWVLSNTKDSGSRITELAGIAKMTKQSMSAMVTQLEEAGYVKRKGDRADKRASLIFLTARGKKTRETGHAINSEFEKKWQTVLGADEYNQLRTMLRKLCESL